jgi:hypothetical protein
VIENRLVRGVFGPKRNEVTGCWITLHSEELYNLFSLTNVIRMIYQGDEMEQHVACMGEMRYAYKIFIGKPQGKSPLRRRVCR